MKGRCSDCAFTIGTEASKAPHTAVIAKLCTMTADPFDCHMHTGACVGWAEEVAERKRTGSLLEPGSSAFDVAKHCGDLMSEMVRLVSKIPGATR